MDKLFLLDAYALIYRAYYAFIKSPFKIFMSFPPFASVKMSLHSYKTKMHFFAQKTYIP